MLNFMGYTIAVVRRKSVKRILECRDADMVIPIDRSTYDSTVVEKPLDKVYDVLSEVFPPLNGPDAVSVDRADECVEYSFLPNAIFIGYVGSQYDELNSALIPLLRKYDCVLYNCDWGTISFPEHSLKVGMFRCKYWLKTNKWAVAVRDTLLLFLIAGIVFVLLRWLSSPVDCPLIDFSSISFIAGMLGAVAIASTRIWVAVFLHFKSRR